MLQMFGCPTKQDNNDHMMIRVVQFTFPRAYLSLKFSFLFSTKCSVFPQISIIFLGALGTQTDIQGLPSAIGQRSTRV